MPKKVVFTSADTGKFVTEQFAKSHPKTTFKHVIKPTPPSKPKK